MAEDRSDLEGDPLAGAMKAAYGPGEEGGRSVLVCLARRGLPVRPLSLHDDPGSDPPVVRTPPGIPERTGDRYQVTGEIARGGIGVVFLGRDVDLGRDVAIKVLHDRHLGNPETLKRFVEEAQIGGQLCHPGVVPVHELGLDAQGRPFIAMKLVKGRTLAALLADRKSAGAERRRFVEIFERVAQTVAYAHARGVIHRDLKPSNVMVGPYGEVLVVDWGLAKVLSRGGVSDERRAARARPDVSVIRTVRTGKPGSDSLDGEVMGTPAYMPPEQAEGRVEDVDERSDVFMLGAILTEILTGEPPYTGQGMGLLFLAATAQLEEARRRLAGCGADEELVALAERCLAPAPADRPRHAGEVAGAVAAFLAAQEERGRKAELEAAEARARAGEERHVRRLTLALSASVLVAVLVAGGGLLLSERGARRRAEIVGRALEEAAVLRGSTRESAGAAADDWSRVLAEAERVLSLARAGGDAALTRRAEEFLAAVRGDRLRAEEAARAEEHRRAVAAALREVVACRGPDFPPARRDGEFAELFAREGIRPDGADPEEVAGRIRAGGLRPEFVAALDEWAAARAEAGGREGARRLWAVADAADGDSWRAQVRRLAAAGEKEALLALARARDAGDQPAASVLLLADALGRSGEAGAAVETARRIDGPGAVSCGALTVLAWWLGEATPPGWPEAVRHLAAAAALAPDSAVARYRLGLALDSLGDKPGAAEAWAAARDLDPARFAFLGSRVAEAWLAAARIESYPAPAMALLKRVVAADPANVEAREGLVGSLSVLEDWPEVASAAEALLAIDPENDLARRDLGLARFHAGDVEGALDLWRCLPPGGRAVNAAWRRWNTTAANLRWIESGHTVLWTDRCGIPGDREPSAEALCGLGHALIARRDLDAAAAAFREALRISPAWAEPLRGLGLSLCLAGDTEGAVRALGDVVAADPASARARYELGLALAESGQDDRALAEWREGIALDGPDFPDLLKKLLTHRQSTWTQQGSRPVEDREVLGLMLLGNALRPSFPRSALLALREVLDISTDELARQVALDGSYRILRFVADPSVRDLEEALVLARRIVAESDPRHVYVASVLFDMERWAEGAAEFERIDAEWAKESESPCPFNTMKLALCHARAGNRDGAEKWHAEALARRAAWRKPLCLPYEEKLWKEYDREIRAFLGLRED